MSKRLTVLFCLSIPAAVSGRLLAARQISPDMVRTCSTPRVSTPRKLFSGVRGTKRNRTTPENGNTQRVAKRFRHGPQHEYDWQLAGINNALQSEELTPETRVALRTHQLVFLLRHLAARFENLKEINYTNSSGENVREKVFDDVIQRMLNPESSWKHAEAIVVGVKQTQAAYEELGDLIKDRRRGIDSSGVEEGESIEPEYLKSVVRDSKDVQAIRKIIEDYKNDIRNIAQRSDPFVADKVKRWLDRNKIMPDAGPSAINFSENHHRDILRRVRDIHEAPIMCRQISVNNVEAAMQRILQTQVARGPDSERRPSATGAYARPATLKAGEVPFGWKKSAKKSSKYNEFFYHSEAHEKSMWLKDFMDEKVYTPQMRVSDEANYQKSLKLQFDN